MSEETKLANLLDVSSKSKAMRFLEHMEEPKVNYLRLSERCVLAKVLREQMTAQEKIAEWQNEVVSQSTGIGYPYKSAENTMAEIALDSTIKQLAALAD